MFPTSKFKQAVYYLIMLFKPYKKILSPTEKHVPGFSIFNISINSIDGFPVDLSQFKGRCLLIVNVASECGYTPQYKELEELYENYMADLVVLGFPSNDFGKQEPGSNTEIKLFCEDHYHVTFPMFEKSQVTGNGKNVLYQWLTDKHQNGWNSQGPKWNFYKYLIDKNGNLSCIFSESVRPFDKDIIRLIREV